jgi:hypothetical protein
MESSLTINDQFKAFIHHALKNSPTFQKRTQIEQLGLKAALLHSFKTNSRLNDIYHALLDTLEQEGDFYHLINHLKTFHLQNHS